jgi:RNA polymerase sigma-70 factor (ECF subfamily)
MVTLYYPLVYRWCASKGLQPHDCVDVAQEVFASVAAHITSFRKEARRDSFRAWLRTIAKNKLNDYWRRQERQARSVGGSEARRKLSEVPSPVVAGEIEDTDADEEAILVRAALDAVSGEFEPRTWKAFWRVTIDGQTATGVARDLGMSRNAVYLAKSRVLGRIREEFGDWIFGETD